MLFWRQQERRDSRSDFQLEMLRLREERKKLGLVKDNAGYVPDIIGDDETSSYDYSL